MLFLSTAFLGEAQTAAPTPTSVALINNISLRNGIFDRLKITNDTSFAYTISISDIWDMNTVLDAKFNGNTLAGNVDFTADNVDILRLKKRLKGTTDWATVFEKAIHKAADFYDIYIDRFAGNMRSYEYAVVPVYGDIEGNLSLIEVQSEFKGYFIADAETIYGTEYNVATGNVSKNQNAQVVNTLDSKYPYVISNSQNNYYASTFAAFFFVPSMDWYDNTDRRNQILEWLQNRKAKILKYEDGRVWMIRVTGSPSLSPSGHREVPSINFDWVEIGDCNNTNDLVSNGLVNVGLEV